MKSIRVAGAVLLATMASTSTGAQNLPDTPRTDALVTDIPVYAVAQHGNTVYIGGYFSHVGQNTGAIALFDAATAETPAVFPKVNNAVRASISDGNGGWYIGGDFTEVDGLPRNRLAHINADGTVSGWNPDANYTVRALLLSHNKATVYVGGDFTRIGDEIRNCIAAISAANGQPTAWNPNANDTVYALMRSAAGPTELVYAAGAFTQIGGLSRDRIALFRGTDNADADWNPNANGIVRALALSTDRETLYLGGDFTQVKGEVRNRIAAVSAHDDAALEAWNPNADDAVHALAMASAGDFIYVGGDFSSIGGVGRRSAAKIRTDNGTATAWNMDLWPSARVRSLALASGDAIIYVGGDYDVGHPRQYYLAAIDTTTASPAAWKPRLNGQVLCIVADASTVFAGGTFSCREWHALRNLAAVDAVTGSIIGDWVPDPDGTVNSLAVSPDGAIVYAGGGFSHVGEEERNNMAAISAETGLPTDWHPDADDSVSALAVSPDGSIIYAGGGFWNIKGDGRRYIAAISAETGLPTDWNPNANSDVYALAVSPDGATVYAGGGFTQIKGLSRNYIAAISAENGLPTDWNPDANSDVNALAVSPDGAIVYAGGIFTRMNIIAEDRNYLAAIDADTGIPTDWNPDADSGLYSLAVSPDGATVYVGGGFSVINGRQRNRIAAIAADTGVPTDWNPGADNVVYSITLSDDGQRLYAGGCFSSMKHSMYGFAMFSPQHTLTYTAGANGAISGTATQTVYHGGDGAEVTAAPDTGYHFTQWSDTSTANPRRDLNVTGDVAVTASFALTLTAPDTPTGVSASAGDHIGEVRLAWNAAARAAGYEIWRDVSAAGADMALHGVSVGTAFADTAVAANINYYYWIRATNAAGASAYSDLAHGFPGVLGPMIMANGYVGDNITLNRGENLFLTVRLNMGEGANRLPAIDVDWWVVAYLHRGGAWYYMDNAMNWTVFNGELVNCRAVYSGTLFNLPVMQAGPVLRPGTGVYNAWFGVDYPADGILDISNPAYYRVSRVTVTVLD